MKFICRVFVLAFTFNLAEASDSFIQSNPNFLVFKILIGRLKRGQLALLFGII
jgi:hypothetical protein